MDVNIRKFIKSSFKYSKFLLGCCDCPKRWLASNHQLHSMVTVTFPCGECVRKWKISKCMICFFELWALNSFETPPFFWSSVRLKSSALKNRGFFHMSSEGKYQTSQQTEHVFLNKWGRAGRLPFHGPEQEMLA